MEPGHRAHVVATSDLSPHMRRILVSGEDLYSWQSTGQPDEYVALRVPDGEGAPGWEEDATAARYYTVRRWDPAPATMTLDVVVHAGGRGAQWARDCELGSVVVVGPPKGYWDPPAASTDHVLVADATGLPAVARILEEASPDQAFDVVVEVADPADMVGLSSPADVTVEWRVSGNGRTPSTLLDAMQGRRTPGPEAYVWIACESAVSRRARTWLRSNWTRDIARYRVIGYWHADKEAMMDRWAALTPEQVARGQEVWDPERPDEVNWLDYEAFLQDVGL